MTTTSQAPVIRYEVVFGEAEEDRQSYTNYGDGSRLSQRAEIDATREFFRLSALRVRCGFCVNGVLTAGEDTTTPPEVEHKTRTSYPTGRETGVFTDRRGWLRDRSSTAYCSCGWTQAWDNRELARSAAREHRNG
jgi:hypothetical protein